MKVLVTGGAGFIGSHIVVELVNAGMDPVIVDNFCHSRREVLGRLEQLCGREIRCHEVDVTDRTALRHVFELEHPEAVIHLAGLKAVDVSVAEPLVYYRNNLLGVISLAEVMSEFQTRKLVFSSSATVYGEPEHMPIDEQARLSATNPYGQTKLMGEQILQDVADADPEFRVTILRYFNPIGAHESGLIGEDPWGKPDNLTPYVSQVAVGRRPFVNVYSGYGTPDGTGVRDYLHVMDLARAHVMALRHQEKHKGAHIYNLGTGHGYSVMEVIAAFEKACGHKIEYKIRPRRPGDVDTAYADPSLAERELGWKARKTLDDMCTDAWRWQSRNPNGFTARSQSPA